MKTAADLNRQLLSLDRKSYPAYKSLAGDYKFERYVLCIDHVQGDPFAAPSRLRMIVEGRANGFPLSLYDKPWKRTALEDHINRLFFHAIGRMEEKARGSGKSGLVAVSRCGQEVLKRTAVDINEQNLTVRFEVGFPAAGRTILARELEKILFTSLPEIAGKSLFYEKLDKRKLQEAVDLSEDQQTVRQQLIKRDLVAFVANGSVLPRESGVSQRPLSGAVPFIAPPSLEITLDLPHRGSLTGMGIPAGITLIVGGGYHGKSTLLKALERGVYNHITGDGREFVICRDSAVKVRAEDGRAIRRTDISAFINNLPNGKDTRRFVTDNASGSTSQAANVAEAVEADADLLLIDEDTSATNFMIRDEIMQKLITPDKEPITPFTDRIRALCSDHGVSTILVVGSSGAYFQLADLVIQMESYKPRDITAQARAVCADIDRIQRTPAPLPIDRSRRLAKGSVQKSERGTKIKVMGRDSLLINRDSIDLRYVEQLVDPEQLMTLGRILEFAEETLAGRGLTLSESADRILLQIEKNGLSSLAGSHRFSGSLAMVRKQEIMACLNRFRGLQLE